MRFADLHLHTVYSDGTYTPQELLVEASKQGLAAIAVVDHDTVAGIEPTLNIAEEKNIEVLPGTELSVEYDGLEVHILGYLIDYKSHYLIEKLNELKQIRIERIYKIVGKLKDMGMGLTAESVFEIAKQGTPGRLHIARAMAKEGFVGSLGEAFQKFIGDRCPAYVCGFKFSPQEAIKLIRDVGGIPVLAHPYILNRDELITQFVDYGLMGLEVYYPEHTQSMVNFYLNLAKKFNLLVTGGSDCHGNAKPEVKIGSIKIPYELVEKLKQTKANTNK
jgi:predicted metal-dependent phosphoesterase TrpH